MSLLPAQEKERVGSINFWRTYGPIFLVALFGLLGTWLVTGHIADLEHQRRFAAFTEAARDRLLVIQRELDYALGLVQDLGGFFDAATLVTRRQFREFVGPTLKRNRIIQTLQWAPRVTEDQRREFVAKVRLRIPRFQIQDPVAEGENRLAPERPIHFPILYVQPYPENPSLLGLDLAGIPRVMNLLTKATERRALVVGDPEFPDGKTDDSYFSIYRPVFTRVEDVDGLESPNDADAEPVSIEEREVRGFAIGVFRVHELVEQALASLGPSGVDIAFWTQRGNGDRRLIFVHRSRTRDEANGRTDPSPIVATYEGQVQVGEMAWTLVCAPVPGAFQNESLGGGWLVPVGGLVLTFLTTIYLIALNGRDRQVRRLVAERTLELSRANEALNIEIAERCRAEQALQCLNMTLEHRVERRTFESERRARDLEQFAYVASHDLKAPLRGIANLSEWLKEDLQDRLTPETQEQLDLLRDRVARMNALIEGLLEYSRIGRVAGRLEEVDVGSLVEEVVDTLSPPKGFRVKIASGLPILFTDRLHLSQVFANLIANSIRHHDRDQGWIRISGRDLGALWLFAVEDDGPGIPLEFQAKVFLMFQTLGVKDYGANTGIGLALVKKLVEEHGGTVYLEDGEDKKGKRRGCRFVFTWAKRAQGLDPGEDDIPTNRDLPR